MIILRYENSTLEAIQENIGELVSEINQLDEANIF